MTDLTALSQTASASSAASAATQNTDSGGDFGTFLDTLLDIVNPLQHLPVVSTLYRSITGDTIGGPARLVGDALYGGPIGAASAMVNLIVEEETGSDIGAHALALLTDETTGSNEAAPQLATLDNDATSVLSIPALESEFTAVLPPGYEAGPSTDAPASQLAQAPTPHGSATTPLVTASAEPSSPEPSPAPPPAAEPTLVAGSPNEPSRPAPPDTAYELTATMTDAQNADEPQALPAWFAAALAAANGGRTDAAAVGKASSGPSPDVISATMSRALDKYQAMAIARGAETATRPGKATGDGTAN